MNQWVPITEEEMLKRLNEEWNDCSDKRKAIFEKYRVPLKKHPIERNGKTEHVFVVARKGNEVMYYEDVEEGFNISPISPDGKILEHGCNQDELKHALRHWDTEDPIRD